ncbi:hypothetical protein NQ166_12355 [Microbacterium sp. zg.Y1090]|uniref:hypothetical protein n=1 Tax=Microbacterium wangruii TaxID=3049073 RepID=UPI00214D29A4|nr:MULTISPECIES: hypothetical protein [unclassified Microbacterium]MCR2819616.1 hypothetical protein [Microbacterium sp. zg.Y1090]WIM28138.1 hypothetical protein QNO26_13475 [Microbacterium sp. zg-Y1090]
MGKREYDPLSAAPRTAGDSREYWNRYDAPGQTFYIAETTEAAYAEVLAPFKRALGATDSLAKDGESLEMSVEEFVEEVAREWSELDFMGLGAIPAGWRFDRGIVRVHLPTGAALVDIEHPDSIAAIERMMSAELATLGLSQLTTGVLRGEDRVVTTAIAATVKHVRLDDGSTPLGIHFGSKHGAAWCKAIWLDHPLAGDLIVLSPEPILVTDDALRTVADRFRIRVF